MIGTFMAILDTSIVNVALPHMMSAFSVNREQIEWVSTAFMLASAVVMPLMGWLSGHVGYKRLYLSSLFVFTVGSALCAMAQSYDELVIARVIQAIGGGAIQPVGMAFIAELFEPHERGRALGIWGTGIMVAPALGPTLGGYLTEWYSWRTIFSVNLPIGAVALLAGLLIMRREHGTSQQRTRFDFWGFTFLSMFLVAALIGLTNGQLKGWDSDYILTCWAFSFIGLVMFVAVESSVPAPILDLGMFRIRNFTLAVALAVFRAVALFGGVFLLPLFLQNLVGYTTIQAGLLLMPGAVAVGLTMPVAGRLADRYSPRILVTGGVIITGCSLLMFGHLDPLSNYIGIVGPQILRGIGLAFMVAPLLSAALNSVPRHTVATASSFLNVAQGVGGAFGIAIVNAFVTNVSHRHAVRIGELLPLQSSDYYRLAWRTANVMARGVHGILPTIPIKSLFVAGRVVLHHADVLGFQNGFVFSGFLLLAAIPLSLMMKPNAGHAPRHVVAE